MKVSKLFMGMLTALALSACSDEVNVPDAPDVNGEGESRFLAVEITTTPSGAGSRANAETDNTNSANYEQGKENENKVDGIRFYFFKADGSPAIVTAAKTNYVSPTKELTPEGPGTGAPEGWPNVEQKLNAVLVLSSKAGDTATGLNSMVAVANYTRTALKDNTENLSLSQLQAIVGNYDEDGTKPFVMTSSVFGADSYNCAAEVTPANLQTSEQGALQNPVKIYIERVVAKVRVKTAWNESITTEQLVYNGTTYNAVPLKNKDGEAYTFGTDNKQIYAIFTGWHVTGTAKLSYLFKNVDNYSNWTKNFANWYWNNPSWFRSYWAINPNLTGSEIWNTDKIKSEQNWNSTTDKLSDYYLKYYTLDEINKDNVIGGTVEGKEMTSMYCQENAGTWNKETNNGEKQNYIPDNTLSNRTQAVFAAILVEKVSPTDGSSDTAKPLDLTEWGGQKYNLTDLKTAMLNSVSTLIYKRTDSSSEETITKPDGTQETITKWKTTSISSDDVEFVTVDNDVVQNGKRYAAYLKLTADAQNTTFYKNSIGTEAYTTDEVNAIFSGMPKAKIWSDGLTYYYYDIEHLGDETTTGKYGIVRNHIYEIQLNQIYGLGTPIYTPDEGEGEDKEIIPEHPGDDDTFLAAKIHILSWRVVNNSAELDWD